LRAACIGIDDGFRLLQCSPGDRSGLLLAILKSPAFEHPGGEAEFGRKIGPLYGVPIHFAQDRVDESGGRAFVGLLNQFDAVGDRGVGGDAVEIAQLEDAHAEGDAHFIIELGLLSTGEMLDEVIELGLISQAAEDDAFGEGEIARVARFAAKQVGGISAAVDALEHSESDFAGRGHSSSMAACG